MFDIGMTELLLIGIVALIVVGPKDLPGLFRTLGRFTAKARSLGREFTRAMNEAADETGVRDVAADLKKATSAKAMGLDALKDAADKFEQWDPSAHPAAKHGKDVLESAKEGAA
ncbi:MAG TPA: twin-arginine translocase subunit TatB [Aliiroseovarius sp.]|nr:twin-arginine translocase subunit TatB [Aliiroseovarius sp.]